MKFAAAFAFVLLAACSLRGGAQASPSGAGGPSPSPLANASGLLDAQVPVPAGFPADFPIYPGARLTAGAAFTSSGQSSWAMEWETLDPVTKVRAFYSDKLGHGGWTIVFGTAPAGSFAATFKCCGAGTVSGTIASNAAGGLTRILMSLIVLTG